MTAPRKGFFQCHVDVVFVAPFVIVMQGLLQLLTVADDITAIGDCYKWDAHRMRIVFFPPLQ